MVLLVFIEVLAELIDPGGQDCNLHFRRAGIFCVSLVIFDDLCLLLCFDRHVRDAPPRHQVASYLPNGRRAGHIRLPCRSMRQSDESGEDRRRDYVMQAELPKALLRLARRQGWLVQGLAPPWTDGRSLAAGAKSYNGRSAA